MEIDKLDYEIFQEAEILISPVGSHSEEENQVGTNDPNRCSSQDALVGSFYRF